MLYIFKKYADIRYIAKITRMAGERLPPKIITYYRKANKNHKKPLYNH